MHTATCMDRSNRKMQNKNIGRFNIREIVSGKLFTVKGKVSEAKKRKNNHSFQSASLLGEEPAVLLDCDSDISIVFNSSGVK